RSPLVPFLLQGGTSSGWIGDAVSLSIEDDPVWAELAHADDVWEFVERRFDRFPVAVSLEVWRDGDAHLLLDGTRDFVRKFASSSFRWETIERDGLRYHRIAETAALREARVVPADWSPLVLCVAALPGRLVLTVDERMMRRTIDRAAAPARTDAPRWTGRSFAARLDRRALAAIELFARVWFDERRQTASWRNLPVLNLWRRLVPDEDPVAVHRRRLAQELVCPGGGAYVWNPIDGTMESTAYGSPISPRSAPEHPSLIESIEELAVGVTFEGEDAARVKLELRWREGKDGKEGKEREEGEEGEEGEGG
ncbi:MAG: hypothetical protein ACF8XB_18655, partial [Planctomycetota bacterium JB042]